MTTKEIMHEMYSNAEIVWGEYHNGICPRSVSVIYDGTEYRIFAEDKPILEEVQRKLELADKWEKEHED